MQLRIWMRWHRCITTVSEKGLSRVIDIAWLAMDRGAGIPKDSAFDLKESRVWLQSPIDSGLEPGMVGSLEILKDVRLVPPDRFDIPERVPIQAHAWISHEALASIAAQ